MDPFVEFISRVFKPFSIGSGFGLTLVTLGSPLFSDVDAGYRFFFSLGFIFFCGFIVVFFFTVLSMRPSLPLLGEYEIETLELIEAPEEHLAFVANQLCRRFFGRKGTISYSEYRSWRGKNRLLFSAVVDGDRNLIGFFDVFPLTESAGRLLIAGQLREQDISMGDILEESQGAASRYIYIASVFCLYRNPHLRRAVIEMLVNFIQLHYPPMSGRQILAFAATPEGLNLLKRRGFILERNSKMTKSRRDLYVRDHSPGGPKAARIRVHLLDASNGRQIRQS